MARTSPTEPIEEPAKAKKAPKPKKTRWYHQVWEAYKMTTQVDKSVNFWLLGTFVVIVGVFVGIGLFTNALIYWTILGVMFSLVGAMFVLSRRAEAAAYRRIEGQPGAARAVIGTIRRGWTFPEEPVFVDPRTKDLVFRGVGRAGVVLVSEGPAHRVPRLLDAERKKVARVASGVPIHLIQMGDGEGQVPLRKLAKSISKLKSKITKAEVGEVLRRLTAIGTARMPLPKGVDPTRPRVDRKSMR